MWIYAEQQHGIIDKTVFELIAKAQELKETNKEPVTAVLLGWQVKELADTLFEMGAEEVIVCEDPALENYSARPYEKALTQLAEKYKPGIILYGATPLGRDLAPRIMVSLNTGLTADAIDLLYDEQGDFCQTTPGYGGKILAHIAILKTLPQMSTVHPGMFLPLDRVPGKKGTLITESVQVEADPDFEVLEESAAEGAGTSLDKASVVVSGGRGIKSEDDLGMLKELAGILGGQIASSRPLVDNGWLGHDRQIGQSGVTVTPDLMFNIGVSGSVQYQLGMQKAKCIVAVNTDRDASIFDVAHYGIDDDYRKFVPALISELKS